MMRMMDMKMGMRRMEILVGKMTHIHYLNTLNRRFKRHALFPFDPTVHLSSLSLLLLAFPASAPLPAVLFFSPPPHPPPPLHSLAPPPPDDDPFAGHGGSYGALDRGR